MTQTLFIEDLFQLCCLYRGSLHKDASLTFFLHRYHLHESVTKLAAKVIFIAEAG